MLFFVMAHRPQTQLIGEGSSPREVRTHEKSKTHAEAVSFRKRLAAAHWKQLAAGYPWPHGLVDGFQIKPNDCFYLRVAEPKE